MWPTTTSWPDSSPLSNVRCRSRTRVRTIAPDPAGRRIFRRELPCRRRSLRSIEQGGACFRGFFADVRNPPPWERPWPEHYGRTLEFIEEADRLGASSIWLGEHHQTTDGYLPQPLSFAVAIARVRRPSESGRRSSLRAATAIPAHRRGGGHRRHLERRTPRAGPRCWLRAQGVRGVRHHGTSASPTSTAPWSRYDD